MINFFSGKLARGTYLLRLLLASIGTIVLVIGIVILNNSILRGSFLSLLTSILVLLILIVAVIYVISLHIRRCHDLALSGWYVLLLSVPVINLIFFLYLLFGPGKQVNIVQV